MNECHVINGIEKNFLTWCAEYDAFPLQIRALMSQGMTLEEAFEHPKNKHYLKQVMLEQRDYVITKPFIAWCQDYLADPLHVRARVSMGLSLEYALKNAPDTHINLLPMKVEGHVGTFLDLCQRYKKAANTIRRRTLGGRVPSAEFSPGRDEPAAGGGASQ